MIGITGMVILFASFLVAFISSQRRKLQYHKSMHAMHEEQQLFLREQNVQLEQNVQERTQEISSQKEELQRSLAELKSTQLQLVQREKMASLGELTAGIAHEIQNPLNFVNNFSDISRELAEELQKDLEAGSYNTATQLAKELQANLEKINFHGRRAEGIVKGMLQHSRGASGSKEPADLNSLADEYLRLSFHAVRVKNKNFTVLLLTEFDNNVGRVPIYAQDIVRVLVNLYNNAFYSMLEKQKQKGADYAAALTVTTRRRKNFVELQIKDNGTGIPARILDKIYQPFFTTKPAGEGTGLGLSLSYDIITKGHGGELKVESTEGEGASFTLQLPVQQEMARSGAVFS
jgi:signal transduction histidine kinase